MSISQTLLQIEELWPAYITRKTVSKEELVHVLVTETLSDELKRACPDHRYLKFEGSTGQGNITAAPWFAVMDTRISTSPQNGFYLVYLFSLDMNSVTLALGLGVTQFNDVFKPNSLARGKMRAAAMRMSESALRKLRELGVRGLAERLDTGVVDLGASIRQKSHFDYQQACALSLRYELDALPDENILATDFQNLALLYRALVEDPLCPSVEDFLESEIDPAEGALVDEIGVTTFTPRKKKKTPKGQQGAGSRARMSKESNRVGRAGEEVVVAYERRKLIENGRSDLAELVIDHVANNETPGWDITSYDEAGNKIFIEVKSTVGREINAVTLTRNEWRSAQNRRLRRFYRVYLVTRVLTKPEIEIIECPAQLAEEGTISVEPFAFEMSLYGSD